MNWITLNGTSSETISGLLISQLPPITKPPIRTEIATVDGRAGDIVTPLGYGAYDRKVTIGLYGSFDLDAVTAFFNTSGVATFSNEPYMVYQYAIYNQIDYARLIRFRTADVTFHVQPFKHDSAVLTIPALFPAPSSRSFTVENSGNVPSAPIFKIYCADPYTVSVDGVPAISVTPQTGDTYIVIDVENMEAYNANGLRNRACTGSYANLSLAPGEHTVLIAAPDGGVGEIDVERYSRWI